MLSFHWRYFTANILQKMQCITKQGLSECREMPDDPITLNMFIEISTFVHIYSVWLIILYWREFFTRMI